MHFSVHTRLGIAPNIGSQVVKELPPSPSSPGCVTCFEGTNRTLFPTLSVNVQIYGLMAALDTGGEVEERLDLIQ